MTPPAAEPLELDEVKNYLRVDLDDDDALIQGLIIAAREHAEWWTRRALITQGLRLELDQLPSTGIELPRPPLQEVSNVYYIDRDGVQQPMAEGVDYYLDASAEPARLVFPSDKPLPETAKRPGAVVVEYTAGYGDASKVPQRIKQAMLLLVSTWYENREPMMPGGNMTELPFAVSALLDGCRVWGYA